MAGAVSRAVSAAVAAARASSIETAQRWREGPELRALAARFADCPADQAEPAADAAEALLAEDGWAGALLAPLLAALRADPFFDPPLRPSHDLVRTSAVLFDSPIVSITGSVVRADALAAAPAPRSMVVPGRVSVTRYVRAGAATLRRWKVEPLAPDFTAARAAPCTPMLPRLLADGDVIRIDGRSEGHLITRADRDVVMLTASVRAGADPLMREYALAERTLIRVASADDRASRSEMLLGYLRRSGHPAAAARLEAATHDPAFHTRWSAMREWLALDAAAALPRLETMAAEDPHGDVRAAAAATVATVRTRIAEARRCRA